MMGFLVLLLAFGVANQKEGLNLYSLGMHNYEEKREHGALVLMPRSW